MVRESFNHSLPGFPASILLLLSRLVSLLLHLDHKWRENWVAKDVTDVGL